jgi:hypothetical protein
VSRTQSGEIYSDITSRTIRFWEERTGKKISTEDARQMVANVAGFFTVLAEWNRKDREESQQQQETGRIGND